MERCQDETLYLKSGPAENARDWKVEGKKKKGHQEGMQKTLGRVCGGRFMAPKGLWNIEVDLGLCCQPLSTSSITSQLKEFIPVESLSKSLFRLSLMETLSSKFMQL